MIERLRYGLDRFHAPRVEVPFPGDGPGFGRIATRRPLFALARMDVPGHTQAFAERLFTRRTGYPNDHRSGGDPAPTTWPLWARLLFAAGGLHSTPGRRTSWPFALLPR